MKRDAIKREAPSDGLPVAGYVRLPQVLELIPVSRTTWWQGCKDGRFPKGVKLSTRVTAWPVESIRKLLGTTSAEVNVPK